MHGGNYETARIDTGPRRGSLASWRAQPCRRTLPWLERSLEARETDRPRFFKAFLRPACRSTRICPAKPVRGHRTPCRLGGPQAMLQASCRAAAEARQLIAAAGRCQPGRGAATSHQFRRVRRRRDPVKIGLVDNPQPAGRQPDRHDLVGQRARRQAARPAARHAARVRARVAVLMNPDNPGYEELLPRTRRAPPTLGTRDQTR